MKRTPPLALSPSSHIAVRAQRLRGGGPSDADSGADGSDEEYTPDARRAAPTDPGTPVRGTKRRLDASELAKESKEAEQWRTFEQAAKEARRREAAQAIEERRAAQARAAAAVAGHVRMSEEELRADRQIAHEQRTEAGKAHRHNARKARRQAAKERHEAEQ